VYIYRGVFNGFCYELTCSSAESYMHLYITELGLFAQLSPNYTCCESNTFLLHLIMKIIPFSPVVE